MLARGRMFICACVREIFTSYEKRDRCAPVPSKTSGGIAPLGVVLCTASRSIKGAAQNEDSALLAVDAY